MDNKQRIQWIDAAKGLGQLLIITGHTIANDSLGHALIYSFHMPCFFLLSFLTGQPANNLTELKEKLLKSAKHLLYPVLLVLIIGSVYEIYFYYRYSQMDWPFFCKNKLLQIIYIRPLGAIWFFVALFIARCVYESISLLIKNTWGIGTCCLCLGAFSVLCPDMQDKPLVIGAALSALPFCFMGRLLKHQLIDKSVSVIDLFVYLIIWLSISISIFTYTHSALDLLAHSFPLFPLCYIAAIIGSIAYCCLAKILVKVDRVGLFAVLGFNSITIIAIHALDPIWKWAWKISDSAYINSGLRIGCTLIIFTIFMCMQKAFNKQSHNK